MKYLAVLKQYGEGCDYTIGCGITFKWVEAEGMNKAADQILQEEGCGYLDPDSVAELKEMFLVCASNVEWVELGPMKEKFREQEQQKKASEKERTEREVLIRLKKKYG